jgi:hypothetical protein
MWLYCSSIHKNYLSYESIGVVCWYVSMLLMIEIGIGGRKWEEDEHFEERR